jgi:hypothetical protein
LTVGIVGKVHITNGKVGKVCSIPQQPVVGICPAKVILGHSSAGMARGDFNAGVRKPRENGPF